MKKKLNILFIILLAFSIGPGNSFAQQNITAAYDQNIDLSKTWRLNNGLTGDYIMLNQNAPNPFTDKTVITFYIPTYVQNAVINVYDDMGMPVKSFRIGIK